MRRSEKDRDAIERRETHKAREEKPDVWPRQMQFFASTRTSNGLQMSSVPTNTLCASEG